MTKREFLEFCTETFGTVPDCPFEEDFATIVIRYNDTKKRYGIVMLLPRRKFGFGSDEMIDFVNMKLPVDMFGTFSKEDGAWIRIAGELVEDDRVEARKSMLDAYPNLRRMYDENDGNTLVLD